MTLYAQDPVLRTRQVVTDAAVAVWVVAWVAVARGLHELLSRLEGPGRLLEDAGGRLAGASGGAGDRIGGLPGVGDRLQAPFDAVADGGRAVVEAGASQQDVAGSLAFWLPVVLAAIPIGYVLARHLPGRVRWAREAGAARVLVAGAPDGRLFALRALATAPLEDLLEVAADPLAAYESGDIAPLADLEQRRLGLRLPASSAPRRDG